ncbi:hypothetical protein J2741_000225 [Methanolinea mesophila]|uniref:coenzyme F430 synthase n=1 Tax=Methanolinea mesophila TaxID=547055 RepID=UPI001AE96309|nr:coenzyme F430 synthase [Methanolinea mesophila]MBP1927678.1 hypothetical protein [Methanolinea mesophila]
MRVLVLDSIHGGLVIARSLEDRGHRVETLDVYRGDPAENSAVASRGGWDLLVAPVHLDPSHPLLRELKVPCITHHQAVRWILGDHPVSPFVEITGARGKTTTAFALASLMHGEGILHSTGGTVRFPEGIRTGKTSITPASLIGPAMEASRERRWMIGEVSLGFTGAGDLGILTSPEDYVFAGGWKHAIEEKLRSAMQMRELVLAPGIPPLPGAHMADELATCGGDTCRYRYGDIRGTFENPLLRTGAYREPLMLAAAAAMIFDIDPAPLAGFAPLAGRLSVRKAGGSLVVDNANSGACARTAIDAAEYARSLTGDDPLVLVIGQAEHAVCEGFPPVEVGRAVDAVRPSALVLVGNDYSDLAGQGCSGYLRETPAVPVRYAETLEAAEALARTLVPGAAVVLSVKTWR